MVYIVLKYYCVLITNSHVLSIALYEFRHVLSGENIRTAAKRRTNTAGRDLLQSLLTTPPGKRVKRAAPKKRIKPRRAEPVKRAAKRRRIAEADVFS